MGSKQSHFFAFLHICLIYIHIWLLDYLLISDHLVNTRLNDSERSHVSSAVDSTWELNEQLWDKAGEACWPFTLRRDQVCVRTVMVKLLSKKIIIGEALPAAGGCTREQETNRRTSWWAETILHEFDIRCWILQSPAGLTPKISCRQFDIWVWK